MIDDYAFLMKIPYLDGGRTLEGLDCYGIPYLAYPILTGKAFPFPSFSDVLPEDKRAMTDSMNSVISINDCLEVPRLHSFAGHFVGNTLVHVGLVINTEIGLRVIQTGKKTGVYLDSITDFKRKAKARFYHASN